MHRPRSPYSVADRNRELEDVEIVVSKRSKSALKSTRLGN